MARVRGADQVKRRIAAYPERYKATVRTVLSREAEVITARLKAEHPWQNVTGAAERGLRAGLLEDGKTFTVRARHGEDVSYGIFLETRNQGRYAVLQPVVRTQWPVSLKRVAAALREQRKAFGT